MRPPPRASGLDSVILGEQFYFFTVVLMWLIHVGFMTYETGVARRKNALATAMKNILTIAVVTPSFYYFGWWIYNCNMPGLPIGPNSTDFTAVVVSGRDPVVGHLRAEPDEQHQPRLLPRLPALLVDDGVDHVRGAARAGAALGLPGARRAARLGRLDPRRRLGLELRRLADAALRLPRLDRLGGGARRLRRLHARRALQPRAADRQVHEGGPGAHLQTPQHPYDPDGADADLHRLLRLLRRLPGDRLDHLPRLGEHLPQPDDPGIDRDDHHLRLRGRLHRRLLRQPRRPVLDRLRRPRRRDQRLRRAPTSTRRRSAT